MNEEDRRRLVMEAEKSIRELAAEIQRTSTHTTRLADAISAMEQLKAQVEIAGETAHMNSEELKHLGGKLSGLSTILEARSASITKQFTAIYVVGTISIVMLLVLALFR